MLVGNDLQDNDELQTARFKNIVYNVLPFEENKRTYIHICLGRYNIPLEGEVRN